MEAVRIIKEMRRATHGEYPKFICWENVPGAFSSNKGEDFRTVLEELIKIVEPEAPPIPSPGKAGWPYADCIVGEGFSLAWRVFDAQHWGVPQRRRRIYLVLDLTGDRAEKILFERPGLRGYSEESGTPWEEAPGHAEDRSGADDLEGVGLDIYNLAVTGNTAASLTTATGQGASNTGPSVMQAAGFSTEHSAKARSVGFQEEVSPTLRAGTVPAAVYDARGNGDGQTVNTITGDHNGHISDYTALACYCIDGDKIGKAERAGGSGLGIRDGDKMYTLTAKDAGTHAVTYCMAHGQSDAEICEDLSPCLTCNHEQPIIFDKEVYNSGANATGGHYIAEGGPAPTLRGTGHAPGVCEQYIVRRLTPTECARLQGFPDRWGDIPLKDTLTDEEYSFWLSVRNTHAAINGRATKEYTKDQILKWYNKLHSDSAEYKMWGNGIALPCALYVMQGIAEAVNK